MDTFYAPLRDEYIRFSGGDALAFLQAMTTNDLAPLQEPGHTRLTGFCSPQGRLLGLMQVSGKDDTFYARVPPGMAPLLIERLSPFVFRSRVDLAIVGDEWCVVGAAGPALMEKLRRADLPVPEGPGRTASRKGLHLMCTRDTVVEMALPVTGLSALRDSLDAMQVRAGDASDWEKRAIAVGIPEVYPATMDEFIPQTVNLDTIGGVSFDKGCYPGQEIVARIRSRGSVKRHMHRMRTGSGSAPAPGTSITDAGGEPVGQVVRSSADAGGAVLLAVITDSAQGSALSLTGNVPLFDAS